jgi:hypothetical protein
LECSIRFGPIISTIRSPSALALLEAPNFGEPAFADSDRVGLTRLGPFIASGLLLTSSQCSYYIPTTF